jgi:DNA (cytosine-5)-methyltransferase 1
LFELITFVANYRMTHLGLFEGIGGFSLAAKWMNWNTLAWCEWNEFGQKVLKHHFPEAEGFGDITKTDFTKYANRIDILTGGFPCQPYSAAGKRLGKEDERHLWPEMLRVIRQVQPSWVVGENVLGLVNWSGGLVFHEVQADLEAEGYEVFPFVLPACAVNAPHRRDRVWFVAHRKTNRQDGSTRTDRREKYKQNNGDRIWTSLDSDGKGGDAADIKSKGLQGSFNNTKSPKWVKSKLTECDNRDVANTNSARWGQSDKKMEGGSSEQSHSSRFQQDDVNTKCIGWVKERNDNGFLETAQQAKCGEQQFSGADSTQSGWRNFPTESPIRFGDDGLSARLDSITFPKWRNESIKAAGNAIVPQVAFQIFKSIAEYELLQPG